MRDKSPTNWDAQLTESNFKTRSKRCMPGNTRYHAWF
ncbi:DUF6783 domain-containing protein [uncultured Robinsoniella sp.]